MILNELQEKMDKIDGRVVIAISGFGGSGKSTLAKYLMMNFDATLIQVDSFIKDKKLKRYKLWNIMDYERIEREVLIPFQKGDQLISYGLFDWNKNKIDKEINEKVKEVLVVEGVGLFRPKLLPYFDICIWVDVTLDEAIKRGKARDRYEYQSPSDELWDGIWKDNELECIKAFQPKECADILYENDYKNEKE